MGVFDSVDAAITNLVGQWNIYSTGLATLFVLLVSYRAFSARDPDVHPMLLARQAVPSPVRQEGESAIYRSQLSPHGMPLRSGLNVRDAGVSKWSPGRDGDLRDVWRRTALGDESGAKGRILTVLGSQNMIEHKLGKSRPRPGSRVPVPSPGVAPGGARHPRRSLPLLLATSC